MILKFTISRVKYTHYNLLSPQINENVNVMGKCKIPLFISSDRGEKLIQKIELE